MATQTRTLSMKRLIGIDPGERWMGMAILTIDGRYWHANMRVLDLSTRSLDKTGFELYALLPATVIAESYQQRPVGHQHFASGQTLRVLGALEYVTLRHRCRWEEVPPAQPDVLVGELHMIHYLERWLTFCPPLINKSTWQHGKSAWRVLLQYMLKRLPALAGALRDTSIVSTMILDHPSIQGIPRDGDLFAPPVRWHTPR